MSLKVIGAGFGRTGTTSLQAALQQLGYNRCHHMKEVILSPRQVDYFYKAAKGENVDWDEVFSGFEAAVDWPSSAYYSQLAEYYPDAKVVLSVRAADSWYNSVSETIYSLATHVPAWMVRLIPHVRKFRAMVFGTVWDTIFDGRFEDRDHAMNVFNKHIEQVKERIPAHRLLVHEAKEGWGPLCAFLDKPIPATPYPRANEARQLKRAVKILKCLNVLPWILGVFAVTCALYLAL